MGTVEVPSIEYLNGLLIFGRKGVEEFDEPSFVIDLHNNQSWTGRIRGCSITFISGRDMVVSRLEPP